MSVSQSWCWNQTARSRPPLATSRFNARTLGAAHLRPTQSQPKIHRPPPASHTTNDCGNGGNFLRKDSFGTDSSRPHSLIVNSWWFLKGICVICGQGRSLMKGGSLERYGIVFFFLGGGRVHNGAVGGVEGREWFWIWFRLRVENSFSINSLCSVAKFWFYCISSSRNEAFLMFVRSPWL